MKKLFSFLVLCLFAALTFQSIAQTGPSATPITQWTSDAFEIRNPKGSLLLGSLDASYCHIYTDRPTFLFNKTVLSINGDFGSYYQNNLIFKTGVSYYNFNGNTRMTILNTNGNVGIGTTAPNEKLEVAGNIKATKFIGDGSGLTGITGGSSQWATSGTSINYSIGNVGIGVPNPTYKLMVQGEIHINKEYPYVMFNSSYWGTSSFIQNGVTKEGAAAGNYMLFSNPGSRGFNFRQGNIDALSIYANGDVGIGTDVPSNIQGWHKVLDVRGTDHSKILVTTANAEYKTGIFSHNTGWYGGGGFVGTESNHNLFLITNYSPKLAILTNGNVLIGKTTQANSAYKLDVVGKIRADEIIVNTTGADFVFEPNYKLRTLDELEAFIKANKHLPEIAPASNMQTNGANMGELQTKLLQKIEELTLYMIELKKENEQIKQEIKELKK